MVSDDAKLSVIVCSHAVYNDVSNEKNVYDPI
jgi:hypothetical protein